MGTATLDQPADTTTIRDKAADALRHAAHVSHEAQLLKSLAADKVEDGVYAARRAMKTVRRRLHDVDDLRDQAVYRIKREPGKAVGVAFGAGVLLGVAAGWLLGHRPRAK